MRRPAAPTAPGAPGERRRPSNCPHCSPSEPVRTQVQDWPAANAPQTPSVPGTKRPPGFGHPRDVGSRAFLSTAQSGPGTGARRMSRGSRARPLLARLGWATAPVPEARPN
ncbi:hypothetical protein KXW67_006474 [Aspergillus fumigatus]|nr:hypothetical protein KXW67_006474 [Aspergillus fumigatus]